MLQIEKGGVKVKQVSLVDAVLCTKPSTSCPCSGNAEQKKIVIILPGGKKLLLKAASALEREEWRARLEAATLLPLLVEEKGNSAASISAPVVDAGEEEEKAKVFHGETLIDADRLPVVNSPEEVENKKEREGKGGEPKHVYALSEGHTTWERLKETQEGVKNDPETVLLSKNISRDVRPHCEEVPLERDEIVLSKDGERCLGGAPSWLALIKKSEVVEPDMMDFDYEEMFEAASEMNEIKIPKKSALINSILRQLIQTMNPSRVPI